MRHYDYNGRDICRLDGVYSIEFWRVMKRRGGPVNCLECVAKARP